MKRVIAMDMDGTLLNSKKKIDEETKKELLRQQDAGALLILASGRPSSGLTEFAKELEMDKHHGLLVAYNGSKIIECQTGKTLFNQTMSIEQSQAVLEHMKQFNVRPMIDKKDYMYVNNVFDNLIYFGDNIELNIIQHEARGGNFKLCEVDDLAKFADYPLNKILTAGDQKYLRENYQAMMEPFKDTLSCMFTAPFYFEFTAKGIDKGKALSSVLGPLGYSAADLIAFGDAENDSAMIEYAGTGVAMANAIPELKEIANEITLSNDENGIAAYLKKLD